MKKVRFTKEAIEHKEKTNIYFNSFTNPQNKKEILDKTLLELDKIQNNLNQLKNKYRIKKI